MILMRNVAYMVKKNIAENKQKNPWTPQDEGDHYPVMKEWWCIETLFKTLEDNRKWNIKAAIAYELETPSCWFTYYLFDITSNKCLAHTAINDDINKLSHKKTTVDLKYEKSSIVGLYPNYHIHLEDDTQEFTADMKYKAKILPHWTAQDSTNGYLPFGFDYFRYGWLINSDLSGVLKINDELHKIKGKGYLEKAWGNWSYTNPFQKLSGFKKTVSTYGHLFNWWFLNRKIKIPNRIAFTTENNPFGYDWFWGVFDNDWSVAYGNSLFWLSDGPAFGVLTLFTEGNNYIDFSDINFHYNKVKYIKEYDLVYPCDLTINARSNDKKIKLHVWSVCDGYEYIEKFKGDNFYRAFILPELPARMKCIFEDNEKKLELEGDAKIAPQRQPSKLGHNSLEIEFIKPPKGVGISFELDAHYIKKKIFTQIKLAPRPRIKMNLKEISNTTKS
jgi:hypothetical protein